MKQETYRNMTERIRQSKSLCSIIIWTDRILTRVTYLVYPAFLAALFMRKEPGLLQALLVPGISFVLLSLFRRIYNAPRPYEVFGLPSVISKETKGKSFPSRHVFSIFIIAITIYYYNPPFGLAVSAAGTLLAVVRVLGGVHFTKDVITGAAVGIVCGLIGYSIF